MKEIKFNNVPYYIKPYLNGGNEIYYDNNTYIGHLKIKRGGFKIEEGEINDEIQKERKFILRNLRRIINDDLDFDEKDAMIIFKALEGEFVNNMICNGDTVCKKIKRKVKRMALKFVKRALKDNKNYIIEKFEEIAPKLYEYLEKKIKKYVNKYLKNNMSGGGVQKIDTETRYFDQRLLRIEILTDYNEMINSIIKK